MKNTDTDTDSYLWLCTLNAIEQGVDRHKIQKLCKYQMGFSNSLKIKIQNDKKGDK